MCDLVNEKYLTMPDRKTESLDSPGQDPVKKILSKKEFATRKHIKLFWKKINEKNLTPLIRNIVLSLAIIIFIAFYVDFGLNIAAVVEYYNRRETVGDVYWIGQIVSLVVPPVLMTVYWAWETRRDTKIRSFMAIVPLGIFYEIFFPIAALLHVWPKLRGHEASDPDVKRIVRLTTVQIIFENLPQTALSWSYMVHNDFSYGVPLFVGISSLVHLAWQFVAVVTSWCNKKKDDNSEETGLKSLNSVPQMGKLHFITEYQQLAVKKEGAIT